MAREMLSFKKDGDYFSSVLSNYPDPSAKYLKKYAIPIEEKAPKPDNIKKQIEDIPISVAKPDNSA